MRATAYSQSRPGAEKQVEMARTTTLLQNVLAPVRAELQRLEAEMPELIPAESKTGTDIIQHVLSGGGKRLRPAMFLLSARLSGYGGAHLIPMAAVCESVHTASLLHDDVVDNSTLRRNRPTANSVWGEQCSVLVGDLVYARASEMMANTGCIPLIQRFTRAIKLMSEGEILQLECLFDPDMSRAAYEKILSYKTGWLIGACCESAGLLAELSEAACKALFDYGHAVGMAFQLVDDALDYSGLVETLGKDTLADLKEGKVTMPVMLARDSMSASERQRLKDILTAKEGVDAASLAWVRSQVESKDTVQATLDLARQQSDLAIDSLKAAFAPSEEREQLEVLARSLIMRTV